MKGESGRLVCRGKARTGATSSGEGERSGGGRCAGWLTWLAGWLAGKEINPEAVVSGINFIKNTRLSESSWMFLIRLEAKSIRTFLMNYG